MTATPMIAPPRAEIPKLTAVEMRLSTERLVLRPIAESDADAIYAVAKDPEFPKWMSWAGHTSIDDTRAFIRASITEREANESATWAIEDRAGHHVGQIGLDFIEWQVGAWRRDRAELGYWIAPAHQRKGYAGEAAHAAMQFAFETLGLHKVTVGCIVENEASKKVIEKSGFRFSHRVDEDVYRYGRWMSHLRYELTFNEWSDVTTTLRFNKPHRS